mmetsp:Transcript_10130/g.18451  ORF Transcript_10130/g.18451 Transcript_10130/m.18451 type:complete len:262 (+) Transcript_10130:87-872(+)
MSAVWVRFARPCGSISFGKLQDAGKNVQVHSGDLFALPTPTTELLEVSTVRFLSPIERPPKMLGLWNNFGERAIKEGWTRPANPLYFLKASNSFSADGMPIRRPSGYDGQIVFEGELGVVIGRRCSNASVEQARECIFGYTCVNDVTARGLMTRDNDFQQWTRAKGCDTFAPFGPGVATGIDPYALSVRTLVNGVEKQNYPVADMFFGPYEAIAAISWDMTLEPGDVVALGTSVGAEAMQAGDVVQIVIDGVGTLCNRMAD